MQHKKAIWLAILLLLTFTACGQQSEVAKTHYRNVGSAVNQPAPYPVTWAKQALKCHINLNVNLGSINPHIFGTNLEWFNDAGGLAGKDAQLKEQIVTLVKEQKTTVMRYPGGTLADFYHWQDGIGPIERRHQTKHPTDPGTSENSFGTTEYFKFLKETHSEGLITVNAGTASAQEAADWVAYANQPKNPLRLEDGIVEPMNIKLWEIGNELYLPGNPGEQKITVTPEVYAKRYVEFSRAIKAVDPTVTTIAIGVAKAHVGPSTQYPDWTKILLENAANDIDMIAVHNAYFPLLIAERQPHVNDVYPALWAAPEAVDRSLTQLEQLINQYKKNKKIGIAITEWGALFSLPDVDNYWLDHVKTMGSGVYIARMLQVIMSHPSVELANYFKLTDRSFMGWINYEGKPKVPFWIFALYANYTGNQQVATTLQSPHYDSAAIGTIMAEKQVSEVTVVASKDAAKGKLYVNLLNRSMTTGYPIQLDFGQLSLPAKAKLLKIEAHEMTAHNGKDIPPEWPYGKASEPYSTAAPDSIGIQESSWPTHSNIMLAPFSVVTVVIDIPKTN